MGYLALRAVIPLDRFTANLLLLPAGRQAGGYQVGKTAPGEPTPVDEKKGHGTQGGIPTLDACGRQGCQGRQGGDPRRQEGSEGRGAPRCP